MRVSDRYLTEPYNGDHRQKKRLPNVCPGSLSRSLAGWEISFPRIVSKVGRRFGERVSSAQTRVRNMDCPTTPFRRPVTLGRVVNQLAARACPETRTVYQCVPPALSETPACM